MFSLSCSHLSEELDPPCFEGVGVHYRRESVRYQVCGALCPDFGRDPPRQAKRAASRRLLPRGLARFVPRYAR